MRELTAHKLNGLNDALKLEVLDERASGGANHLYQISYDNAKFGPDPQSMRQTVGISFQNGPIAEVGVNGISGEVLLAIVIDRLQGFQSGQYKCRENAVALTKIEEALMWLQKRTRERLDRGVEGTTIV